MSGAASEPRNSIERAADAALEAMRAELAPAEIERAFILLHAKGLPQGERDAVTAGTGIEDSTDLLAFVVSHLIQAGREVGLTVMVVPIRGEG